MVPAPSPAVLTLFVHRIDRNPGGQQQQHRGLRLPLVHVNDVVVGGREELFRQTGPFLADLAQLGTRLVQEPEVPALPVAFDLGDQLIRVVVDVEAAAQGKHLALEVAQRPAVSRGHLDPRTEQREAAVDRQHRRTVHRGADVHGRRQHPFVDQKPQDVDQRPGLFHGHGDLLIGVGLEDVKDIRQLQEPDAFLDEIRALGEHVPPSLAQERTAAAATRRRGYSSRPAAGHNGRTPKRTSGDYSGPRAAPSATPFPDGFVVDEGAARSSGDVRCCRDVEPL